jgi:ABC-type phosphate transport system permease subunit
MQTKNLALHIKRPPGIIAGLTAACAIFGLFLAVDSQLGLPPGTFYKMIGLAFGIGSSYAVYGGFVLYMITAAIIGIIYGYITTHVRKLYPNSVVKGLGTGILAGVIVWAVLFLPLNYGVMQPALRSMADTLNPSSPEYFMARQLLQLSNTIIFGSLALHIVFGGVMGFCGRLSVA